MKQLLSVAILAVIILFGSCSSITVTSDYDKSVDFSKFTTYSFHGWVKESDKILSPFDKERIESAFEEQFNSRGLKFVKEGGELVVALFIVTKQKTEQVANTTNLGGYSGWGYGGYYGYGPGWGYGPGFGGPYMGTSTTTISNVNYTVGTLVCDVFDANDKKLIWEGVGSKTVDDNLETRDKNIPKAVAAIMAQYPVKPTKTK